MPEIDPVSVEYLLKETLMLLKNKAKEKRQFSVLLKELSKDENKDMLIRYFEDIEAVNKRISITNFIALLSRGKVDASSLKQYTGIQSDEQVSLIDIAVIILHDFMAEYL